MNRVGKEFRNAQEIYEHIKTLDNKTVCLITYNELCELNQKIFELEKRLEMAIVPKFKKKQRVYFYADGVIGKGEIDLYDCFSKQYLVFVTNWNGFEMGNDYFLESQLFATKSEAEKALEELK